MTGVITYSPVSEVDVVNPPGIVGRRGYRGREFSPMWRYEFDFWHRSADAVFVVVICLSVGLSRPWLTAAVLVVLVAFNPYLYRHRLTVSVLDELPRVILVGVLAAVGTALATNPGWTQVGLLRFSVLVVAALIGSRLVVAPLVRWSRRSSAAFRRRTLIVGTSRSSRDLAATLCHRPEFGLHPVAFADAAESSPVYMLGLPVESPVGGLVGLIRRYRVRTVIIGFGHYDDLRLLDMLRDCDREDIEVFIVPRLFSFVNLEGQMDRVNALPLTRVRRSAHRSLGWRLKRPVDLLLSGLALVLLSPVYLAVAIAVHLDDPSAPVIFRQIRVGEGGREFELLKFRSMRPDDDAESRTRWNIAGDPRISPLGRFLRKTSLDELPQIVNVFRGDMALVGPRPERPVFVERFGDEYHGYHARHRVPVGLTGWAAIHGLRGDTSIGDRVIYDNYYIENWSPWLDAKSIILTAWVVLRGGGA